MELLLDSDLVLSWTGTLIVPCVGFGLISEAVFGPCGEGSTLRVLAGSWSLVPALEAAAFAGAHFGAVGL